RDQRVDCVVAVTTLAVFSGIAMPAVTQVKAPLLIWNPQTLRRVTDGTTLADLVGQASHIGTQALANTLLRQGFRCHVVSGRLGDRRLNAQLDAFFSVIRTIATVRRARMLTI